MNHDDTEGEKRKPPSKSTPIQIRQAKKKTKVMLDDKRKDLRADSTEKEVPFIIQL